MRASIRKSVLVACYLLGGIVVPALNVSGAQIVTNWMAFNDHRPGPLIPPHVPVRTNWGTARWVTTYDMGAPNDATGGNLTNIVNGQQLAATVRFNRTGAPDDFGTVSNFGVATNTPAGRLFFGICDLSNSGIVGVDALDNDVVTITFSNLNPEKRYLFRGTGARGGGYLARWTVTTINAGSWIDAHTSGPGSPGVITSNDFPANLGAGQAAWNSGDNVEGDLIGWDFITPAPDGSFTIVCAQYVGPIPGGAATDANYGYSFGAMLLAEVEVSAPSVVTNPPALTAVEQNRPITLHVTAAGTPLLYQWYKEGVGAIAGATFPTYSIAQAALADAGNYYAVVYNPLASVTSTVAQVVVSPDVSAPSILSAFSYPTFDRTSMMATMDQIVVEYNEPVNPTEAGDAFRYSVSGGVGLASVVVTNSSTVVLRLSTPLAEDTAYSVSVSGIVDPVGNTSGNLIAPFRSWMSGPGNGLLFEAFDAGAGVDVVTLTTSANFPDKPFLRTNLWTFESRAVFPDDSHNNYGSRIRGVFIPPVSGNWVFFLRAYDRAEVYLNPNGLDAAGKQLVVAETTGNDPRDWNKFQSSPFYLRAGQAYYMESLHKAEGSTDAIKVAARLAGTGQPATGVLITDLDTNALTGPIIGYPLAPRDLGGPLTILQEPADASVDATHYVTFSFGVSNALNLPVLYQWYRNGLEIPGATGPNYTFRTVLADDGSTFSVRAAKLGSTVTSRTATLHVQPDVTKPTVVAVHGSIQMEKVIVSFSEPVNTTVDLSFNFTIPTFTILSATGDGTGTNVVLTLDRPLPAGSTNDLTIELIEDFSTPTPNIMDTTNVALRAWVISRGFAFQQVYLNIGSGTTVGDLTGNVKYPNSPDSVAWVPTLEGPNGRYDNYGTRLSGWIAPPLSGSYLFYMCSDDSGNLLLSPDSSEANAALIAQEMSYNDFRVWTGDRSGGTRGVPPSNISTNPVPLTAGQMYAFVVLQKDGTGGDNSGANWQIPGFPVPTNGSPGIAGAHLYCLADPVDASITVTQQPANVEATLPATVSFSVGVASTFQGLPNTNITYLWQRDDGAGFADIIGAYGSAYSVTLTPSESGAKFRALAFSPGASVTSQAAGVSAALRVSVTRNGNAVRISWPLPGTGVTLQRTTTLVGNPPPWTPVPPPYQTDASSVYVEIPVPTGNAFYRLAQ